MSKPEDVPLTIEQIVERMAWRLCFQENEVWDEAPQSYRDRWRREAAQMFVPPGPTALLAAEQRGALREREAVLDAANTYMIDQYGIGALANPIDRERIFAIRNRETDHG